MSGCGGFGHAWNWTGGRWGFLWLRSGGHFWCYHCPARMTSDHQPVPFWPWTTAPASLSGSAPEPGDNA